MNGSIAYLPINEFQKYLGKRVLVFVLRVFVVSPGVQHWQKEMLAVLHVYRLVKTIQGVHDQFESG